MKPIKVWNLNAGVEMKPIGVKLKDILHFDPDALVKMPDIIHFNPDDEGKTVDNDVWIKPSGQILVNGFYFDADAAVKVENGCSIVSADVKAKSGFVFVNKNLV